MDDDRGGFDDLRLRFLFIPHGATVPEEVLAEFSDPVRIPAEFLPRPKTPVWAGRPWREQDNLHAGPMPPASETGSNGGDAFTPPPVPGTPGSCEPGSPRFDRLTGLPADPTKFFARIGTLPRRSCNPPSLHAYFSDGRTTASDPRGPVPTLPGQGVPAGKKLLIATAPAAPAARPAAAIPGLTKGELINYYTSDVSNATARALGISRDQLGAAVQKLKGHAGLRGNDNIRIHIPSGEVLFNDESIGNVYDEP